MLPKPGDKVRYVKDSEEGRDSHWTPRTENDSIVIMVNHSENWGTTVRCWELWPHDYRWDREWSAGIDNIRVVARANYTEE